MAAENGHLTFCHGIADRVDQKLAEMGFEPEFRRRARQFALSMAHATGEAAAWRINAAIETTAIGKALAVIKEVFARDVCQALTALRVNPDGQTETITARVTSEEYELQPGQERTAANVAAAIAATLQKEG